MANSIQELLLAAQTKKSPFMALLEGAASGFGQGLREAPERVQQGLAIQREEHALQEEEAARTRATAEDQRLRAQLAGAVADKTKAAFNGVGAPRTPAHPGVRLQKTIKSDPKTGYLREEIQVLEPKALQPREYADAKGRARIGKWDPEHGLLPPSEGDPFAPVSKNSETDPIKKAKDLRGEFTDLSKDFFKVNESVARIRASAADPSAAGDLALIFNFMKVLDPGSVVRESEFATAQNAAGVPEQIRAQYNKALSGERLTPDTRKDFVGRAEGLFEAQRSVHQRRVSEYERLAQAVGADPKQVIVDQSISAASDSAIALTGDKGARLAALRAKAAQGGLK